MTGRGRPLRFLALVMLGWVGMRAAMLWPAVAPLPTAIQVLVPVADARAKAPAAESGVPTRPAVAAGMRAAAVAAALPPKAGAGRPASRRVADPARVQMALLGLIQYGAPEFPTTPVATLPMAAQPVAIAPMPSRWSASAWLVARPGTGLGAAPGASQLGGSQAGLRISYLLLPEQRVAGFARVAVPLAGRGAEAAIGIEW